MNVETGVRYNFRKVYRLIGSDLYSAMTTRPLEEQVYTLEKEKVVEIEYLERSWRVSVCAGRVCLEDEPD